MKKERNSLLSIKIIKDKIKTYIPSAYKIKKWANLSFNKKNESIVIIKLASSDEIMKINKQFFNKKSPCNVLSFPNNSVLDTGEYILGDIIICPDIVKKESDLYNKDIDSRWAHMIIHSMLHLQGYTHQGKNDKLTMEKKERELMHFLGYQDPYYAN
jgi:probable rRNA maturation factor